MLKRVSYIQPKRCVLSLLIMVIALSFVTCGEGEEKPPPVPAEGHGESLRILTYNTTLFSPTMRCLQDVGSFNLIGCLSQSADISSREARVIAANILMGSYDVVALNEVWDDDAKGVFVDILSPTYPHYVKKIDTRLATRDPRRGWIFEDSGLMLFSKFPFLSLPNPAHRYDRVEATTDQVAFRLFPYCEGLDCRSAKGAGLVRIQSPYADLAYNVVFTHMQADDDKSATRRSQLESIRDLLERVLGETPLGREHVFVIGDLNINGLDGVLDPSPMPGRGGAEWNSTFGSGFFFDQLADAWARTGPLDDLGIPTDKGRTTFAGKRVDYVLVNKSFLGKQRFCVQHMTIADLGPSSHLALKADYNAEWFYCDPRTAWQNPPLEENLNENIAIAPGGGNTTEIKYPGSMQWFHFQLESPATVSIGVTSEYEEETNAGVLFDVYQANDLSTVIAFYEKTVIRQANMTGYKYGQLKDFYVRVYSPNRSWTGDYSLFVHENSCLSQDDACILYPGEPYSLNDFMWPTPPGTEDFAWFEINIEKADSERPQHLRFFLEGYTHDRFNIELRDKATPTTPIGDFGLPVKVVEPPSQHIEGDAVGPMSMYMLVPRGLTVDEPNLKVGWETNLTIFHGMKTGLGRSQPMYLICHDETNPEFGSDEIRLKVTIDDGVEPIWFPSFGYAEYDCDDSAMKMSLEDSRLGSIRFVSTLKFELFEDRESDDRNPFRIITPLPPNWPGTRLAEPVAGEINFCKDYKDEDFGRALICRHNTEWVRFRDGHYQLKFNLSRRLNQSIAP